MKVLKDFIHGFDFVRMKPARSIVKNARDRVQMLAEVGKQYAGYFKLKQSIPLKVELPAGKYQVTWLDAVSGEQVRSFALSHSGGEATIEMPREVREYALAIRK
jgi:hypothetical protein